MTDAYENYYKYKLSADPFRLSPDHRFAYSHPSYAKARAYLEFAIRRGEGFITITGGPGTGKTTLINEIVASIGDSSLLMATLNSTQLESRDLLHMVAAAFGLRYGEVSKATLLLGLEEFLTQQQRKNKRAVLIVDEAQGLSPGAIEELRLLANLQKQSSLLLQVVLVGQEQLRDIISAPGMEHLSQRIIVASHLDPLSLPDTVTYVEHRLKKVRWQGDPAITEDALRLIHKFSGGVPRRINLICSRLFLFGGLEGKHELTGEDAQNVIADLQQESLLPKEAAESVNAEEAVQETGDDHQAPPLSLPRDAPASSPASDDVEAEPRLESQDKGKPGSRPGEVEDILSSKAQLREALGQVFASMEDADKVAPGPPRRRRQPVGPSAVPPAGAPAPEPGPRQRSTPGVPKADVSLAASRSARKPRPEAAKSDKPRSKLSLLVVAAGLALAFTLIRLDSGDSQPEGDAPGDSADESTIKAEPAAGSAAAGDDGDPAISANEGPPEQAIAAAQGDIPEPADPVTDTVPAELDASEPVSPQQDGAPQSDTVPVAVASEESELVQTDDKVSADAATPPPPAVQETSAVTPVREQVITDRPEIVPAVPQPPAAEAERSVAVDSRETVRAAVSPEPQPAQTDIDEQRVRLAQEARERFARQLEQARLEKARLEKARLEKAKTEAAPVPRAPVTPPRTAPQPSQPKTSAALSPDIKPSVPKVAVVPSSTFGAPAVSPKVPVNSQNRIKAALLEGRWTSQGKPATLLPSDVTLCRDEQAVITCWSVPRNVNTKFGEALYKVEATLQDFSGGGDFRVAYRTLVKLVGAQGGDNASADSSAEEWQVSEYTTDCQLTFPNQVSCRDEQGVTRTYSR